jgi:hypothetical protein
MPIAENKFIKINDNQLRINLAEMSDIFKVAIFDETEKQSDFFTRYIQEFWMTGGMGVGTKVRSGNLRRTTRPVTKKASETVIKGGSRVGAKYAEVHIGNRGDSTTIKPVNGQYLAIPIGKALKKNGAVKNKYISGPKSVPDKLTAIRSKKGNLLLVEFTPKQKLMRPVYLLKKEVTIPKRIFPKEIFEDTIDIIARAYWVRIGKELQKKFTRIK